MSLELQKTPHNTEFGKAAPEIMGYFWHVRKTLLARCVPENQKN
jgi:hypothetical protein